MNIIELARQAGLVRNGDIGMKRWEGPRSDSISDQDLEAFAALVAAAERKVWADEFAGMGEWTCVNIIEGKLGD